MRLFFLLLISSWLWGIGSSVYGIPWWVSAVLAALFIYLTARRHHLSWQLLAAAGALWFLGSVYGSSINQPVTASCSLAKNTVVTIDTVWRISERTVSYIGTDTNNCRLMIRANRFPVYNTGTVLTVHAQPKLISDLKSEEGYKEWLTRQGIYAVSEYSDLTVQKENTSLRTKINNSVHQHIVQTFSEPESSFVAAMLLAEQGSVPETLQEQFKKTGTSHILAISGLNISLLTGMILALLVLLPLSSLQRSLITISLVWLYMFFIGWPISAVRASLFWSITLLALHTQRLISLAAVLILTTILLVSYNPALLQDIGFQLSLTAVIGIGLMLFLLRGIQQQLPQVMRIMLGLTSATIGATLTTWPIVMYHFGNISLISLPANLLLEPVFPLMLVTGIVTVLVSFIFPPLALLGSFVMHLLYVWLNMVTYIFSEIPWMYYENLSISWWVVVLYYVVLITLCIWLLRLQKRSWREVWV